jgi:hypothetical protein
VSGGLTGARQALIAILLLAYACMLIVVWVHNKFYLPTVRPLVLVSALV